MQEFLVANHAYVAFGLRIAVFLVVLSCVASIVRYFVKYRIIDGLVAKTKDRVFEYDRIRRTQMREDVKLKRDVAYSYKKTRLGFLARIYKLVALSGIIDKIPGFSEFWFCIVTLLVGGALAVILAQSTSAVTGVVGFALYLFATWQALQIIAYNRKIKLESQLLQLTNVCASASLQYSSIIDIIGATYDQFSYPLRDALQACYVEAKETGDTQGAIERLESRFDSVQFELVIDNLMLCSAITGDYHTVAKDLSGTIAIYAQSHEKKRVALRNAKANIVAMFLIAIVIVWLLSKFMAETTAIIFHTTAGNIAILVLVGLLFYGLSLKAEK